LNLPREASLVLKSLIFGSLVSTHLFFISFAITSGFVKSFIFTLCLSDRLYPQHIHCFYVGMSKGFSGVTKCYTCNGVLPLLGPQDNENDVGAAYQENIVILRSADLVGIGLQRIQRICNPTTLVDSSTCFEERPLSYMR
jgi:hypothetical protein